MSNGCSQKFPDHIICNFKKRITAHLESCVQFVAVLFQTFSLQRLFEKAQNILMIWEKLKHILGGTLFTQIYFINRKIECLVCSPLIQSYSAKYNTDRSDLQGCPYVFTCFLFFERLYWAQNWPDTKFILHSKVVLYHISLCLWNNFFVRSILSPLETLKD